MATSVSDSISLSRGAVGNESNFHPVKAADLLTQEAVPLTWTWESWLPDGALALLAAYMKVGKSTLAYLLGLAVAQGKDFLGYPTKQGPVLILAVEEHPRDIRLRLEKFGLRAEDELYVHSGRLSRNAFPAIQAFVMEHRVRLVILDTLSRFWNIKDENANAEVVRLVEPFLDLAHETNTTVLLLHHERKSGGDDGRGIRGGSALFGLVDQALFLEKRQDGNSSHRVLKALGRYADSPSDLVIELIGDDYCALGTSEHLAFEAVKDKAQSALDDTPATPEVIATRAKLPPGTTRKALEALLEAGKANCHGRGVKGDPVTYCRPA